MMKNRAFKTWNGVKLYYTAGYTSGGVPYGVTCEENETEGISKEKDNDFLDGDLPF